MAHFKERSRKTDEDDGMVILLQDGHNAWYIGKEDDDTCHPHPMGAFISKEAATKWADHHFPGGDWR